MPTLSNGNNPDLTVGDPDRKITARSDPGVELSVKWRAPESVAGSVSNGGNPRGSMVKHRAGSVWLAAAALASSLFLRLRERQDSAPRDAADSRDRTDLGIYRPRRCCPEDRMAGANERRRACVLLRWPDPRAGCAGCAPETHRQWCASWLIFAVRRLNAELSGQQSDAWWRHPLCHHRQRAAGPAHGAGATRRSRPACTPADGRARDRRMANLGQRAGAALVPGRAQIVDRECGRVARPGALRV